MDVQTIDQDYAALEAESQDTIQAITALAQKLQAAGDAGDGNAREWILDLKEIAVNLKDEQTKVAALLQSLHDFVVHEMSGPQTSQWQQPPQYQQQPQYQPNPPPAQPQYYGGGGGVLSRFLGGGFGRAVAMGAGFGIGDDIINQIF